MPKVVVYIRASDAKELEVEGKDVSQWVRELVRYALEKRKEAKSE